jgi:hypothetical protein
MAKKKQTKVTKVKTASIGTALDGKEQTNDLDSLKAKLLKDGKKSDNVSDMGAKILNMKPKKDESDSELSDLAKMLLASKSKEEPTEEEKDEEVIEQETIIEEEVIQEEEIIEEEVLDDIELELDIIEEELEEIEEELEEVELEVEIIKEEVEEVIEEIIEEIVEEEIIEETVVEPVVEKVEDKVEEPIVEVKPEPKPIKDESEINFDDFIKINTVSRKVEVYNAVSNTDKYVTVRAYKKLEDKSTFTLHIPKVIPKYKHYETITDSPFNVMYENKELFDFYTYSGKIDFTINGMLFNGKLYPFNKLIFNKI